MTAPWLVPRTAYIHVPFCAHHCAYCDFAVSTGSDHLVEHYLHALELELATLGEPRPVETRFIGGGTPTYLNPDQLARLLRSIERWLPAPRGNEYSIESTPASVDRDKAALLAQSGVTRVSVGAQSFQQESLRSLDRRHGAAEIPGAIAAVRAAGLSLSLDLIFAAPGSTVESWNADLEAAVALGPDHISTYGLTYEKGTRLWKQRREGMVRPVSEEAELAMYEHAIDRLASAGFEQYEVSNFARPCFRCRHNERYWANEAYYGFGVGAARYVKGVRELNTRDTRLYIQKVLAGESPVFQSEELEPRDRAFETIGTQIRRSTGIDQASFHEQTGFDLFELAGSRLEPLIAAGLLAREGGGSLRLTRRGLFVADAVIEEIVKANVTPG